MTESVATEEPSAPLHSAWSLVSAALMLCVLILTLVALLAFQIVFDATIGVGAWLLVDIREYRGIGIVRVFAVPTGIIASCLAVYALDVLLTRIRGRGLG